MRPSEIQTLLDQYLEDTISKNDLDRLWETVSQEEYAHEWKSWMQGILDNKAIHGLSNEKQARLALAAVKVRISFAETNDREPVPVIGRLRLMTKKILPYAASIIIITGIGLAAVLVKQKEQPEALVKVPVSKTRDILPGGEKALLTLADGTTIVLDNAANGTIAQQGHMKVIKLANGQLKYIPAEPNAVGETEIASNTMSTPKGGQYQLTLPDGSNVWLNAASSITYPTAFTGQERSVRITGEVYFEVAKDKTKPFRVQAGDQLVEVLGTHFNINAYSDEGQVKTSLLEGSVRINKDILKPGQAYVNGKIGATDTDQDIAWKNGVFNFNDQSLVQVMRQLARWYDLEISYPKGIPKKIFGGEMGRNLTLDQVLKGLDYSGVQFELRGRRLLVQ